MNPSIKKLAETALKKRKTIIGLMSGTSLDGLDIALCTIEGNGENTSVQLQEFLTSPYTGEEKKQLRSISSVETASLKSICYLHTWLADIHSKKILDALDRWNIKPELIDCIASHGQTIYHYPAREQLQENEKFNTTLQIGDGDHIARKTGILTLSDFRQKHTAAGGEGAPMAAQADRYLFRDTDEPRILLNIGGIANFTYLPKAGQDSNKIFTTDTGPGNTLIDRLAQTYFDLEYDEDGKKSAGGNINDELLQALLSDNYFSIAKPETTGPERFNISWIEKKAKEKGLDIGKISPEDQMRTLTELSAVTIVGRIKKVTGDETVPVYVSGGGMHNPVLMERIKNHLGHSEVYSIEKLGMNPDAKEAVVFAVLANEMLSGKGFKLQSYADARINFGKISFPE